METHVISPLSVITKPLPLNKKEPKKARKRNKKSQQRKGELNLYDLITL